MFIVGQKIRCIKKPVAAQPERADQDGFLLRAGMPGDISIGESYVVDTITRDGKIHIRDPDGYQSLFLRRNAFDQDLFRAIPRKNVYNVGDTVVLIGAGVYHVRDVQRYLDAGELTLYGRYQIVELSKQSDIVGIKKANKLRIWVSIDALKEHKPIVRVPNWL